MKYFKASDFDDYSKMAPRLLCALDSFRELTHAPVYLSPAPGAQWRMDGTTSQHNAQPQSRAVDIFPTCAPWDAFVAALSVPEIKGIGIYPHWRYKNLTYGMHLDVRSAIDKCIWWRNKDNEYTTIHSMKLLQGLINEVY